MYALVPSQRRIYRFNMQNRDKCITVKFYRTVQSKKSRVEQEISTRLFRSRLLKSQILREPIILLRKSRKHQISDSERSKGSCGFTMMSFFFPYAVNTRCTRTTSKNVDGQNDALCSSECVLPNDDRMYDKYPDKNYYGKTINVIGNVVPMK